MKLSHHDELLLQRHLDSALDATASAAFAARLASEPELASAAVAARAMRVGFTAARTMTMRPPASFTASVVLAARQLPTRQLLEQADLAASAIGWCRRILLAAGILAGIGLLWQSGLMRNEAPPTMQADPADVQHEIERLDALLQAGK